VCSFHDYQIIIIAAQQARGAAASQKQQFCDHRIIIVAAQHEHGAAASQKQPTLI